MYSAQKPQVILDFWFSNSESKIYLQAKVNYPDKLGKPKPNLTLKNALPNKPKIIEGTPAKKTGLPTTKGLYHIC